MTATNAGVEVSPHWAERQDLQGFIDQGFPFNEGFPSYDLTGRYQLILRDGSRMTAMVDYSTQYRSEGLQWRAAGPAEITSPSASIVAAWSRIPSA